jgi:hypothetical protein
MEEIITLKVLYMWVLCTAVDFAQDQRSEAVNKGSKRNTIVPVVETGYLKNEE